MAKGARRAKGGAAGVLDTFNRVEIGFVWKDGRGVQPLTDCGLTSAFSGIKRDLEKSAYAAIPLELALHVAHENEPSEDLFAALAKGLETLNDWKGDAAAPTCWTLLGMLAAAGFAPSVHVCGETGQALRGEAAFSLDCGVTAAGPRSQRRLAPSELAALRVLDTPDPCPEVTAPSRLIHLLGAYAERQMDITLRSMRVLRQVVVSPATSRT